jgi:hypothetical protein
MRLTIFFALASLLAAAGCRPFEAQAPAGFAPYESGSALGRKAFRAVSAEGVVFRVRAESTKSKAALPFWKEAIKKRMLDAGYTFVSEADLTSPGGPGYLLELAAPIGARDYSYLVAIFVKDTDLVIAEAAGEVLPVVRHKKAIGEAIAAIRF